MKRMTVKKWIVMLVKFMIAAAVLAFLGLKSLDFFMFTTPAEQWYYAYLGFALTSGSVIAYLLIFMWDAETQLQKTIAIIMLVVSVLGELATAGFGLQIDAWQAGGFALLESDFDLMVRIIQLLGFAHAMALIFYYAGDKLVEAFSDEDGDGIPNAFDSDYKGKNSQKTRSNFNVVAKTDPVHAYNAETRDETSPTKGRD